MQIVGGTFKGRALCAPAGRETGFAAEAGRERLFDILAHAAWAPALAERRVLDLFAGSGALGLEAISRGAAFALFVDTDAAARGAIRDNIEALALYGATRIHRRDATDLGPKPAGLGAPFDLVFLAPPRGRGLGEAALAKLGAGGWIGPEALIVLVCGADETPRTPGYAVLDQSTGAGAKLIFLRPA